MILYPVLSSASAPLMEISSGDGLVLSFTDNGSIAGIAINDTQIPMLGSLGGFSFREVLTNSTNPVTNPGFEDSISMPMNWSLVTNNGSTPVWDTVSRNGSRSIKISISGTSNNNSGYPRSDLIKAQPFMNFTLSAWVKTQGANGTGAPAVRVVELDANKKWLRQTSLVFSKGTNNWTQKQINFKTTANTSYLYVYADIWKGYGTFWVDDVSLSLTGASNLLGNPGFERSISLPLNWSFVSTGGNTPTWDNVSKSGAKSIKISIPGTADNKSGYPKSDLIRAEPLQYYTLSAWVKTEGAGGKNAPAVRVVELDSNRNWITQTNLVFSKGTNDWVQKKTTFRTGINTSYLYVYANIWNGYGTFWLDDVALAPFFGPTISLNGTLTQNPDGTVTQRARANSLDFTFYYIPKDRYIELQGEVQDMRGEDRAVQVMFNVPVNAEGWRWGDYIRGSRVINGSTHYENVYKIGDVRTQSTYPFASIDNNTHGMSIAVPMDVPRIYRKGYDLFNGYSIQYDFGLSNQTLKIGAGRANFTFVVYKTDEPEWGFRSVVKKYYELYPQFFEKRNEREGTVMWIAGKAPSSIPNASDFGFAYDVMNFYWEWTKSRHKSNLINGIYTFQYTEPWGWWRSFGDDPTKPSYEERMAALQDDALNGANKTWREIVPLNVAAQTVLNSAPYDEDGKMYLDANYDFWARWSSWMQNYPTNPDPDIPSPNRFEISYEKYKKASVVEVIENWKFEQNTSWDSTVYHSGNYSAKIEISGNESKISGRVYSSEIPVKTNTLYEFSAWGKTESAGGNYSPAVRIVEIDTNGTANYSTQRNLKFDFGTKDWIQKKLTFTTSNNTATLFIYANIWNGYGTFWFDDVGLYEINNGTNLVLNAGVEEGTKYRIDGITLDYLSSNVMWATLENNRAEHLKYADNPLVFSDKTGKSVILNVFSQYEYIDKISNELHNKNQLLSANSKRNAYNFYAHLLDVTGNEIGDIESDDASSHRRTLSSKKTISNILQWKSGNSSPISYEDMKNYITSSTFYGIFPSISREGGNGTWYAEGTYWLNSTLYERDRDLFRKYIPLIKNLSKAGWEPVTYAYGDNNNIFIERYGNLDPFLFYTFRTETGSVQTGTIYINLTKFNIVNSANIVVEDVLSNSMFAVELKEGNINFNVTINPRSVSVYEIRYSG